MVSAKRLFVGMWVVGVGLVASLPFHQKQSPNHRVEQTQTSDQELLWLSIPSAQELASRPSLPLPEQTRPDSRPTPPVVKRRPPAQRKSIALDSIPQPPDLADEFEWLGDGLPTTGPVVPLSNESYRRGGGAASAVAAREDSSESPDSLDIEQRTLEHHIADGDSLETLAQYYLGSPTRWNEIYDVNRERLSDPQLLPIGAMLRIPVGGSAGGHIPD